MASEIVLPKLGNSVEECVIKFWNKNVGDEVKENEALCEVETDKTSVEVLSTATGVLLHTFYEVDEVVPILKVIAIVGSKGESIEDLIKSHDTSAKKGVQTQQESINQSRSAEEDTRLKPDTNTENSEKVNNTSPHILSHTQDGHVEIQLSPRAATYLETIGLDVILLTRHFKLPQHFYSKEFLEERDLIDYFTKIRISPSAIQKLISEGKYLSIIRGSGIDGRIIESDIEKISPELSSSIGTQTASRIESSSKEQVSLSTLGYDNLEIHTHTPFSRIRKIIADRMHSSLQTSAQVSLNTKASATNIKLARTQFKKEAKAISINDMVLYSVSRVLNKMVWANSILHNEGLYSFSQINLGFAVQTQNGLMVPHIIDAGNKTLDEISKETKKLAKQCMDGSISPELLKGGTFTCSNLGTWGIQSFTPVINTPQTAILGIGEIEFRVKELSPNKYDFEPCINLSLTFDHRAYDGVDAADLLAAISKHIEHFSID